MSGPEFLHLQSGLAQIREAGLSRALRPYCVPRLVIAHTFSTSLQTHATAVAGLSERAETLTMGLGPAFRIRPGPSCVCPHGGSRFPLLIPNLGHGEEMGTRPFRFLFSQPPVLAPARCMPKARPACKPSAALAHNPRAEGGSALGALPEMLHGGQCEIWDGGRESRGLIEPRGVGPSRAGPESPSYPPAGTRRPPPRRFAPRHGASSPAQQSGPARPAGDHASVPKWAEAAGRGGPLPGSPSSRPHPRPAPEGSPAGAGGRCCPGSRARAVP